MDKIAVVGLGYVGLQMAVALAEKQQVVGYDISKEKIDCYQKGVDCTKEIGDEIIKRSNIFFTSDENNLQLCNIYIVCVPTPNMGASIDMSFVERACRTIKQYLKYGDIVILESTMYIGATKGFCKKILSESGLRYNLDYYLAFSPERINPGDSKHRLKDIAKVIGCENPYGLLRIENLYAPIVKKVVKTESIEIAEATKLIENVQRDVNIAIMNEFAQLCQKINIDIYQVLSMANTKWNFCSFVPGLVGGHCIGIDTNYLLYNSQAYGLKLPVIESARITNESMVRFIAENIEKFIIQNEYPNDNEASILILGLTYKPNVPDVRNSKVIELVKELEHRSYRCILHDPYADPSEVKKLYGRIVALPQETDYILLAVPHDEYLNSIETYVKYVKRKIIFALNPNLKHVDGCKIINVLNTMLKPI